MLGVDWSELLLVGVVALIVVGPKDLPMLMGRLGKAISAIRRMGNEFQREINKATGLDTVTDLRKSLTEPLKKASAEITREFNKITPTGVEPSGVIKPAIPGAQSVVNEIHAAAGMTPAAADDRPEYNAGKPSADRSHRARRRCTGKARADAASEARPVPRHSDHRQATHPLGSRQGRRRRGSRDRGARDRRNSRARRSSAAKAA